MWEREERDGSLVERLEDAVSDRQDPKFFACSNLWVLPRFPHRTAGRKVPPPCDWQVAELCSDPCSLAAAFLALGIRTGKMMGCLCHGGSKCGPPAISGSPV